MSWQKKLTINLAALCAGWALTGCGVKGDPLPPEKPAELGRGRPTYKGATEEIKIEKTRAHKSRREENEDSDDDDKE